MDKIKNAFTSDLSKFDPALTNAFTKKYNHLLLIGVPPGAANQLASWDEKAGFKIK